MKLKLLVAILLLAVGQIVAQSDGPLAVVSATVSEWDGCRGKLNVVINIPSSWHGPLPVVFSSNIGKSCPYPTPYSYGCYSTGSLGTFDISVGAPTQATWINAAVGMDYMPNSVPFSVLALPTCKKRSCSEAGPCSCKPGGTNSPSNDVSCGQPINLATGNTYISQTDVKKLPGTGPGLTLKRIWNSLWPSDEPDSTVGLFGPRWRSTYEENVHLASDGMWAYSAGDGSFVYFALNGGVWTAAVPMSTKTVLTPGSSYWTLTFESGETRYFSNASRALTAIKDRNGNTTQIAYDSLGRIVTVTDSASRHLYFAYTSNTSRLVSTVTSDIGISLSYSYDIQGRLVTVTNPDQSTENFEYSDPNGSYLITSVKDSQGKVLESHTYDSTGRGLTSSRANGVEALSIAYSN